MSGNWTHGDTLKLQAAEESNRLLRVQIEELKKQNAEPRKLREEVICQGEFEKRFGNER